MGIASTVRRAGLAVAGAAGAAAICVACGSSTSGSPISAGRSGVPSVSVPSLSLPSVSLPSASLPSVSIPTAGVPSISLGGSGKDTPFCKDLRDVDTSSIGTDPASALKLYDKLADDAPPEIKPDVEKIRDFLRSMTTGQGGSSDPTGFSKSLRNLGTYAASHCFG
jgi:hypothetical protein